MSFSSQVFVASAILTASQLNQTDANIDAVRTQHKGPSAPANLGAGVLWLEDDNPSSTSWLWKMNDGTDWITLGTVDSTANTFSPAGVDSGAAFSGVIETDATFVSVTQPFVMPDGSGTFAASVKDAGADGTVEIWAIDVPGVVGGTVTASVTLTGAATVNSIAQSEGYLIIGSEDGIHIVDSWDGSWAERTYGYPKSSSTSTTPALASNSVSGVAAMSFGDNRADPLTGRKIPYFGVAYSATKIASIYTPTGIWDDNGTGMGGETVALDRGYIYSVENNGGTLPILWRSSTTANLIVADSWNVVNVLRKTASNYIPTLAMDAAISILNGKIATAGSDGLTIGDVYAFDRAENYGFNALITRTTNSGCLFSYNKGAFLANSATADLSGNSNTLTATGTITEAAVASGAELMGYSGFADSTNWLSRAADSDFSFGTSDYYIMGWFMVDTTPASSPGDWVWGMSANAGAAPGVTLAMNAGGILAMSNNGVGAIGSSSAGGYDDGEWHMAVMARRSSVLYLYIDTVLITSAANTTDFSSPEVYLGAQDDGQYAFVDGNLSLVRYGAVPPTVGQINAMFAAEKGMFVANAKCLLQSGTTDGVLDVSVDPNGKVAVTQTDSMTIWDGLVATTQATSGANTVFEHLKSWNDTLIEIGTADMSISRPLSNVRATEDRVEILEDDLANILGTAKAWLKYDHGNNQIDSSFNVASVSDLAAGRFSVTWAIPFKGFPITFVIGDRCDAYLGFDHTLGEATFPTVAFYTTKNTGTNTEGDAVCVVIAFGELEGEET